MTSTYLDHAAATPLRPEVLEAMLPHLEGVHGNPSAVHQTGRRARKSLDDAREQIADLLGVPPGTVHFVRGGTESDNLAVLGRFDRVRADAPPPLFVRTGVEHSAVREAMEAAASRGAEEVILPLRPDGTVDEPTLEGLLERRPALVSVQWVNQETGSVLPVAEVAERCRDAGVPVHSDAVQAVGRVKVNPGEVPVDLLSLSAHKLGGPRGMGVLVVRRKDLLSPRLFGGGQENGLRPGTEDVAGAVGMAAALERALHAMPDEAARLGRLRDRLQAGLAERVSGLRVHGGEGPRAPHILNVGVPGLPRDLLPRALDVEGIATSAGSACRSGGTEVSPVLEAYYGHDEARAVAPLRLSLGWTTSEEEVERALENIPRVVARAAAL